VTCARLRRDKIGFVFQAPYLIPFLDVTDNVALLPMLAGVANAESRAPGIGTAHGAGCAAPRSRHALATVRRRAAARGHCAWLVNRPPVILADEPTAPLDSERAMAVIRILNDMARKFETAIIVVTHDEKIIPTFKRIYHIRDGVTHEEAGEGRGLDRFQGWGNQLKNEPAFEFAISQKYKKFRGNGVIIPGFSSDLIRSAELRLGNIETSATLGVQARMGWSLPNDFGSYALKPGAENRPPPATSLHGKANVKIPVASRPHPGLHFFTILEAKLVGYDYTLDGNFFHDSHSVSRRPWVAHAAVGISAQSRLMGHGVKMAVMRVYRTREFEEQKENQNYGSIAVGMNF
jgi:energy-coupling factor transporter ATP-binding protein EcfA2